MKKSILALGAAAVVGGLGFAGSAHAIAYFGASGTNHVAPAAGGAATSVELNPGGTGHYLFVPYFSTQGTIGSMINITNTDVTNGKLVKVRFRGAANSDDVLDFTVLLSPGDVWAANLTQGADGRGTLSSANGDTTCTLPAGPYVNVPFNTQRIASYLDAAARTSHTREGYVEVLNMADVPPTLLNGSGATTTSANPLYTNIKHAKDTAGVWKAPCAGTGFSTLLTSTVVSQSAAEAAGLAAPTGQLMGTWAVLNQAELAVYGSSMTAVQAVASASTPTALAVNGYGRIAMAPQLAAPTNLGTALNQWTADPLLRSGKVTALWFDLPDMSTPLAATYAADAVLQANALSVALSKPGVLNDYNASTGSVPMDTDWVVSQPTRRYHAAVSYGASASAASLVFNDNMTQANTSTVATGAANNAYSPLQLQTNGAMGPYACLNAGLAGADREERMTAAGADFSPGTVGLYCGEVFTLSFNSATSKVLQSQVANTPAPTMPGSVGWARLTLGSGTSLNLPIVGFAATSIVNRTTRGNFGLTLPHRW